MIPRTHERPNTIALQWDGKYEEGRSAINTTIYPGMALEVTVDEQNPQQLPIGVKPNSSASANSPLRVAMESLLGNPRSESRMGMKITDPFLGDTNAKAVLRGIAGVTTAQFGYGDWIPYFIPKSGDIWQARVAPTANFAIGDLLQRHTDGTLVAVASGVAVAQVVEDLDLTAPASAKFPPLLRVQAV